MLLNRYKGYAMYKAILLSIGEPTTFGIYYANSYNDVPNLVFILRLNGKSSHVLPLLFAPLCAGVNDIRRDKIQTFASLLQPNIMSLCDLCECIIDRNFFIENEILQHDLTHFISCDVMESGINYYDKYGIYNNSNAINVDFIKLECGLDSALQLLTHFTPLHAVYYSRGVGSLSAIKLTHIFLHTLALSMQIPIYATNSFYFSRDNEIKAFANMSFFLDAKQHLTLTDENACKYIRLATSSTKTPKLHLPYNLIHDDFLESCTPLYVTPAV